MNVFQIAKRMFSQSAPRYQPSECAGRVRSGEAVLVDVREPDEWSEGVAEAAVLLSFRDLTRKREQWRPFLANVGQRELLFYCAAGVRAAIAARVLAAEGFRTANTGSLSDWAGAGWKIVPPPGSVGTTPPR